jgi:hypothetical protein
MDEWIDYWMEEWLDGSLYEWMVAWLDVATRRITFSVC